MQKDPHETVFCRNPADGAIIETTAKVFTSIYVDKGFVRVNAQNADAPATRPNRNPRTPTNVDGARVTSAKDIAAGILDRSTPPEPTDTGTFTEMAGKAKASRIVGEPTRPAADAESGDTLDDDAESGGDGHGEDENADLTGGANEDGAKINAPAITDDREPTSRDRGRGPKVNA